MADINLKKSQADLNEAEADKKRGVDTALAKAQEELTRANIDVSNMSVEEIAGVDTEGQNLENKWQEIENRIQLSKAI